MEPWGSRGWGPPGGARAPPLWAGRPRSTNQMARGAGRGRSGSGPQLERRERSETRRGAQGSEPAPQSPSSPFPSPRRLLLPAAGPELCDPEVPVPLLCGINSNGGGCSSRNNSQTIRSRSGSGGGGSGLPHPHPHSHLPVRGGGGRGRRRRRRRLDETGHLQVRRCAARRWCREGAGAAEEGQAEERGGRRLAVPAVPAVAAASPPARRQPPPAALPAPGRAARRAEGEVG